MDATYVQFAADHAHLPHFARASLHARTNYVLVRMFFAAAACATCRSALLLLKCLIIMQMSTTWQTDRLREILLNPAATEKSSETFPLSKLERQFLDPTVLPYDQISHLTAHQISFADCKVGSQCVSELSVGHDRCLKLKCSASPQGIAACLTS